MCSDLTRTTDTANLLRFGRLVGSVIGSAYFLIALVPRLSFQHQH